MNLATQILLVSKALLIKIFSVKILNAIIIALLAALTGHMILIFAIVFMTILDTFTGIYASRIRKEKITSSKFKNVYIKFLVYSILMAMAIIVLIVIQAL